MSDVSKEIIVQFDDKGLLVVVVMIIIIKTKSGDIWRGTIKLVDISIGIFVKNTDWTD